MAKLGCPRCLGPADPLHTARECQALQQAVDYDERDRHDLAVVSSIIDSAGGGVAAAIALRELGWLRWKA